MNCTPVANAPRIEGAARPNAFELALFSILGSWQVVAFVGFRPFGGRMPSTFQLVSVLWR